MPALYRPLDLRFGNLPRSCLCFCKASPLKGNFFFGTLGRRSSFGHRRSVVRPFGRSVVRSSIGRRRSAVRPSFGRSDVVWLSIGRGSFFFPWCLARLAETQLRGNLQANRGVDLVQARGSLQHFSSRILRRTRSFVGRTSVRSPAVASKPVWGIPSTEGVQGAEQLAQSNLRRATCADQFAQSTLSRATCAEWSRGCDAFGLGVV